MFQMIFIFIKKKSYALKKQFEIFFLKIDKDFRKKCIMIIYLNACPFKEVLWENYLTTIISLLFHFKLNFIDCFSAPYYHYIFYNGSLYCMELPISCLKCKEELRSTQVKV